VQQQMPSSIRLQSAAEILSTESKGTPEEPHFRRYRPAIDAAAVFSPALSDDPEHVHQPLIQTIVDELNGSGKCPSIGESAARTAHVMEKILAEFRLVPKVQRPHLDLLT